MKTTGDKATNSDEEKACNKANASGDEKPRLFFSTPNYDVLLLYYLRLKKTHKVKTVIGLDGCRMSHRGVRVRK